MSVYSRISDEDRKKIPDKDRCEINYNGYHAFTVVNISNTGEPFMVCTKCQCVVPIVPPKKQK